MAATILGNQGATAILQSTRKRRDPNGVVVEEVYRADKDNADAIIGAYNFGDPHGTETGSVLVLVDHDKGQQFSTITLTYEPAARLVLNPPEGTIILGASTNVSEFPIEQHPSFAESWTDSKRNQTGYFKAQTVYRRTEVLDKNDWDWTEANLISGMNAIGAPTGLDSATAANWIKILREPEESGETVILREEWLHNPDGWDTDIY